ncbi:MAG: response regulator [Clostridiales bacterium]|nr:response regulator [Clostridiales bacterium]
MTKKKINILLIEDNPGDVDLILYTFKKNRINNEIKAITSGEEALDFIFKRNNYENALSPDLIILDINLPKISGLEILKEIKSHSETKMIPTIILTTSKSEMDILTAYENFASAYVVKPVEIEEFIETIAKLDNFWLDIVKLPNNREK